MRLKSGEIPSIPVSEVLTSCTLVKVLVGKCADDQFHIVDREFRDHSIYAVCEQFGTYVVTVVVDENIPPQVNAFTIMMEAQKQVCVPLAIYYIYIYIYIIHIIYIYMYIHIYIYIYIIYKGPTREIYFIFHRNLNFHRNFKLS